MPIEIRELQIKVTVNQPAAGSETSTTPAPQSVQMQGATPEKLVADAVEQVMDIIRNKNER